MSTPEFKFYCHHCHQPLRCDTRFAGRQIECPRCLKLIRIPDPPEHTGFTQVTPESGQTWEFGLGALNPQVHPSPGNFTEQKGTNRAKEDEPADH